MHSKADTHEKGKHENSGADALRWALAACFLCIGLFGYHHYSQYPAVYRGVVLLPVLLMASFLAVKTTQGMAFWALFRESLVEVRKVVWPTRQESTQTTLVVVGVVFLMALVLWGLDAAFGKLISLVIS